jgi:hypothetical protein
MARDIDFYGPYLKTERAKQHIDELKRIFEACRRANENTLWRQQQGGSAIGGNFPKHTPTILGDAIHNLRAALDHAYCVLVEAAGGTVNKHTKFPFTEKGTRQDLEGSAKGQAKAAGGPSDKMLSIIFDEIEPFPGGKGADLIGLHVLDIADKHMVLLPTQQMAVIRNLRLMGGGGISGIGIITSGSKGKPAPPAVTFGPGVRLDPQHQQKATVEICFGGGQPFEGQSVERVLDSLANRVNETLRLLEQRAKETS